MFEGWMTFAGVEIVNTARAAAMSRRGGGPMVSCECRDMAYALADPEYDTVPVEGDEGGDFAAPWYDPGVPESKDVFGFIGVEFTGAQTATGTREWTELLSDGGVPGALRRSSRELGVKLVILAAHEDALSWATAWLASALRGSNCSTGCGGEDLCMYNACPVVKPGDDADTLHARHARELYHVALVEGPEVTSRQHLGHAMVAEVEFTLKAGIPWWHRAEKPVPMGQPEHQALPGYDPWAHVGTCDDDSYDCMSEDPFCTPDKRPPAPVALPTPVDPCFPNNPANNPPGKPNAHTFNAVRTVYTIPRGVGAAWLEKVPVIRLYTGYSELKRTTLRWYDNPQEQNCSATFEIDPCRACAEITIPWLPRATWVTIDGRTKTAVADCAGGGMSTPRLYGADGGAFVWPVFDCSAAMCLELLAQSGMASDMKLEVSLVEREDAL